MYTAAYWYCKYTRGPVVSEAREGPHPTPKGRADISSNIMFILLENSFLLYPWQEHLCSAGFDRINIFHFHISKMKIVTRSFLHCCIQHTYKAQHVLALLNLAHTQVAHLLALLYSAQTSSTCSCVGTQANKTNLDLFLPLLCIWGLAGFRECTSQQFDNEHYHAY